MKLLDIPLYCFSYLADKNREPLDVGLTEKILVFIAAILIIVQIILVAVRLLCPF